MKFLAAAALAATAVAVPLVKRQGITDGDILQFALTLEHLENVFYKGALSKFSEKDFTDAGYTSQYYNNLKYIAHDEEAHVQLLTTALSGAGAQPVAACEYSFPYTDVKSFITLSSVLEGVGTTAYLGAAPAISNKDYLSVAGSILVTEALHTSLQRTAVGEIAAASPYGSSLIPNGIYTLAAAFIKSCPSSNAMLPFKAFPELTAITGNPTAPGVQFLFGSNAETTGDVFITFVNGLSTISQPALKMGIWYMAPVPVGVEGQTYALLTSKNVTKLTDSDVIAGPAILEVTPASPTIDNSVL